MNFNEQIFRIKSIMGILKEVRGGHNKDNKEDFIRKGQERYKNENGEPKYDYSLVDYLDSNTKVKLICPEHIDLQKQKTGVPYFEVIPSKHSAGQQGCPFESKREQTKHSDEELKSVASKVFSSGEFKAKYPSEYYASRKRTKKIPNFYKDITSHFTNEAESVGEKFVTEVLVNNNLISANCLKNPGCSEREVTLNGCVETYKGKYCRLLKFDFYLKDINTVIEYDGDQHFRASDLYGGKKFDSGVKYDLFKNKFCSENQIKMIRIPYTLKFDKIESELMNAINNPDIFQLLGNYPKKGWNAEQ